MIGTAFSLLIGLMALSLPVAAALGVMGYILQQKYAFFPLTGALGELAWNASNDFILIAAPMFIMMGELMHRSGVSERLFTALAPWFARGITGTNVANLTLDKLNFEGGGSGWGLRITKSSNMKVKNSTFSKFDNGLKFQASSNISVDNNSFTKMFIDEMQFAGLTNAVLKTINTLNPDRSQDQTRKKIFIQFFTNENFGATASKT